MRTTLDLPDALVEDARALAGTASLADTIVLALQELVHRRRIADLKSLMGTVALDIDLSASRRRPA